MRGDIIPKLLPSDPPKKPQDPLPPMLESQSAPQELGHTQRTPAFCVMNSMSADETN